MGMKLLLIRDAWAFKLLYFLAEGRREERDATLCEDGLDGRK